MPELKIPQHPTHSYHCHKCKYWLRSERRNYILTAQGPQLMTTPIAKDDMPMGTVWANMAPCARFPDWALKSKDHWCYEFVQTIELK